MMVIAGLVRGKEDKETTTYQLEILAGKQAAGAQTKPKTIGKEHSMKHCLDSDLLNSNSGRFVVPLNTQRILLEMIKGTAKAIVHIGVSLRNVLNPGEGQGVLIEALNVQIPGRGSQN